MVLAVTMMLCTITSGAQVAINSSGALPDASAALDVSSTAKGVLIPRMTEAERDAIVNPAEGLMIYQTDGVSGFYYRNATNWAVVGSGTLAINDLTDAKGGSGEVFLGSNAGLSAGGSTSSVGIGSSALRENVSGIYNIAIGNYALYKNAGTNSIGAGNIAVGSSSMWNNTEGRYNTAIGVTALYSNILGDENVAGIGAGNSPYQKNDFP